MSTGTITSQYSLIDRGEQSLVMRRDLAETDPFENED
jgi:hypothetical protein